MVKPTNNSHCEAISIEAKTSTPAGEVCNLASLEGLINSKLYYKYWLKTFLNGVSPQAII